MQLSFLTPLYERPGPWASVHLDTSWENEATTARRELQARDVCDSLARQGADDATGRAVYDALMSRPGPTRGAGRAVFATAGQVVLDPPLAARPPAPVDVQWSALPHVSPLLDLAAQEPMCLVAYIDRLGADLEIRTPLGSRDAGEAHGKDWPMHRTGRDDWSERHFQQSVENTWEENAGEVAAAIAACDAGVRADLIVLVGDPRERRAVHDKLPPQLGARTVESEHGGRAEGTTTRLLDQDIEQARHEHLRHKAEEELNRFRSAHDATAEGVPALVEAAREHRIAELLVRPDGPDTHREVWVGGEADQLAVRRSETQYLGDTRPASARADDALLRSATVTGAEVQSLPPAVVGGDDVPAGGLGALLRWPYEEMERR
ncbi:Vms1/Ankzf1 family peptidyl-tRNA hydrolase [Streptomyces peucetius]|uniref:Vms1/Ankzf1 family peptidyl-tRNA hydrolase n=1 Tax=Streptomyces peucetius TaxID=1950 RepID=A0ABY6I2V4_STRPE|nr:Vms1/Ankzf1 family peptidyl-tRNA hydrolase [Streptomyces peucetius]UYQ60319.1 Vms1/Ankzf1 family peptidyl-tRNA hydrolase [Streptomyces peucetius]